MVVTTAKSTLHYCHSIEHETAALDAERIAYAVQVTIQNTYTLAITIVTLV
jgi:hypothetical protein